MTERNQLPDHHVPDVVLEELLAAFGTPSASNDVAYDFDDPSIDRLLGIDTVELRTRAAEVGPPTGHVTTGAPETDAPASADLRGMTSADPAAPPDGIVALGGVRAALVGEPTPAKRATVVSTTPAPSGGATSDRTVDRPGGSSRIGRKPSRKQRRAAAAAAAAVKAAPTAAAVPAAAKDATPTPVDPATPAQALAGGPRVIVIADDDQHIDPIYLDEGPEQRMREIHTPTADGSGGRSTIVIDEFDQHGDAVQALASSSSAIDPRLRARRIAVRRAVGRRRLVWTGIIAGLVIVAVAVVAVLASSIFDVRRIEDQGDVYTDPALIQAVKDELRGTPILLVDTQKYERQLEASPWIEAARVSTDFPHRVLIDIRERVPRATFVGSDGRYRVIDRDGRVLAVLDGRPIAYMLLTGTAPDSEPGQFAGAAYAAAAQLVIALPADIRRITSSVGVDTTSNELTLALDPPAATGVEVRLGTVAGIEDKLARLLRFVRDGLVPDQHLDVSTAEVGT